MVVGRVSSLVRTSLLIRFRKSSMLSIGRFRANESPSEGYIYLSARLLADRFGSMKYESVTRANLCYPKHFEINRGGIL
ncbi:hypothetical protein AXFE_03080 [Acidithrix ferrooxidans]|uniref:Uncharacterized protein n=1 Tax=Acidithrix ferrooxidans TaxID=1280514 RepID=A0A0D8HM17_9ACTN|nr:hypothetical protein AXFE_03080 [Acidithrix ferrooxidans]